MKSIAILTKNLIIFGQGLNKSHPCIYPILDAIQKDELVHHGMAKKFYESKFPEARLQIAFKREKMKNRFRMFYYKNLKFLNKIFDPILNFIINVFGKVVNLISIPDKDKRNLIGGPKL